MRDEITEPQEWSRSRHSSKRRYVELSAEVVDAAMEVESKSTQHVNRESHEDLHRAEGPLSIQADIIASLSQQLDILESQREQLQKLLDQAQG